MNIREAVVNEIVEGFRSIWNEAIKSSSGKFINDFSNWVAVFPLGKVVSLFVCGENNGIRPDIERGKHVVVHGIRLDIERGKHVVVVELDLAISDHKIISPVHSDEIMRCARLIAEEYADTLPEVVAEAEEAELMEATKSTSQIDNKGRL